MYLKTKFLFFCKKIIPVPAAPVSVPASELITEIPSEGDVLINKAKLSERWSFSTEWNKISTNFYQVSLLTPKVFKALRV